MKNKTVYFLAVLLACIAGFYSCEKQEEEKGTDVRDLIVNNTWAYDTLELSNNNDAGLLVAALGFQLTYMGSEYDFSNDGTYTLTSDYLNTDGVWELVNDDTIIIDKGTEDELQLQIVEITNTDAKLMTHVEGDFFGPFSGDVTLLFKSK